MAAEHRSSGQLAAAALLAVLSLAASATAQGGPIDFARIHAAETSSYLDLRQERRVFEPARGSNGGGSVGAGRWITAQEQLRVAPLGTGGSGGGSSTRGSSLFALDLLGIVGAQFDPQELQFRQQRYREHAGYLHMNASFRIEDPVLAAQNYFLFDLGPTTRVNRPAQRLAVLPLHFGVNPWLLDVDVATGYPLYRAEFDSAGRMVSELVVTQFANLDPNLVPRISWWAPSLQIDHYATVAEARAALPTAAIQVPQPGDLPSGFQLAEVRVVHEDLAYEPSLVTTWSDGIDELFVAATLNAQPLPLPDPVPGSRPVYALYEYQDLNTGQYQFYTNGVRHTIVARAGQLWSGGLALQLLTRSLSTN